jgi:hypothetical protein
MGEGDITFDILLKKYKYHVSAEALFFASGHNKALRVEAPTLNKEFTDGAYIGAGASSRPCGDIFAIIHGILFFHCQDPKGFLFYKDTTSFDGSTLKYTVSKISSSGTTYAHIKFYHDSPTDYYIEVYMLFSSIHSLMLFYSISSLRRIPCVLLRSYVWVAEYLLMNHRKAPLPGRA